MTLFFDIPVELVLVVLLASLVIGVCAVFALEGQK